VPTVLAFVALSVGQLLSYGDAGIMAALTARSMVGRAGRRLLAVGLALPLLLALLLLAGYRQRLLDAETAMMVVSWGTLALLAGAVWGLAIAVDRAELARGLAERQRNSLRQMLVAALSHDLRSPLQVATLSMSALQWLDGNERSHALKRTQQSLGRIDRLLHSLLDSLAVDSGKPLALRPVALELVALVRQVVAEHEARLDGRVRIEGAPVHGWWDHDALFRVVENLLLNAAKYGTAGGAIECALRPMEGERVCLTVRNGGPAIPPAEWELIFQPFSRGAGAQQSGQIGWGVGLAYARAVITRHGGSIRVDSSDQRGTTFAVTLPLDARRHQ
jgi:signal transduction histidine kinase